MKDLSPVAADIHRGYYARDRFAGESWSDTARRVTQRVVGPYLPRLVAPITSLIERRLFIPGGRYLANAGRPGYEHWNNCYLMRAEDSREGWARLIYRVSMSLMTGGGVGVDYTPLRPAGATIRGSGGASTGPISLAIAVDQYARTIRQGGGRRAALYGSLHWLHEDIFKWIHAKDEPGVLAFTNISVNVDDDFWLALERGGEHATRVFNELTASQYRTGEPGWSMQPEGKEDETLRNACTEVSSADDDDVCNLGSLVLSRMDDEMDMTHAAGLATAFLLCGSIGSDVAYEDVKRTRAKNRRLGLGLMGVTEWIYLNGLEYGPSPELGGMLQSWQGASDEAARHYARELGVSVPVATRAIAPNGTTAIVAETTSGIEAPLAPGFQRRYYGGELAGKVRFEKDAAYARLVDQGVKPEAIRTAYDLRPDERLAFQRFMQRYVDHGISSTVNFRPRTSEGDGDSGTVDIHEFRGALKQHTPYVRGVTVYPDAAIEGQPLTAITWEQATQLEGLVTEVSNVEACKEGVCGI